MLLLLNSRKIVSDVRFCIPIVYHHVRSRVPSSSSPCLFSCSFSPEKSKWRGYLFKAKRNTELSIPHVPSVRARFETILPCICLVGIQSRFLGTPAPALMLPFSLEWVICGVAWKREKSERKGKRGDAPTLRKKTEMDEGGSQKGLSLNKLNLLSIS